MTSDQDHLSAAENPAPWSLVERARSTDADVRREALQSLLDQSVPGLRLYLTYQLHFDPGMADDLLQEFMLEKVLSGELLAGADSQRGHFHSLLRTALRNFVLDRWRWNNRDKRRPDRAYPLTDEAAAALAAGGRQRTDLSEVAHAWQTLIETLNKLHAQCRAESRPDLWGVFEERVLKPAALGGQPTDLDVLALRFGYASKIQVSNALMTVQRKLNRMLRQVLLQYVPPAEIDAEINQLHRVLSDSDCWQPALAELGSCQPESVQMSVDQIPTFYNAAQLSESLRFVAGKSPAFGTDVLAESLRALLNTPARQLATAKLGSRANDESQGDITRTTVGALLRGPAPSVSDLVQLKEFAKREGGHPDRAYPRAICTLLYFAAIVAAGIHLNEQISSLGAEALLHGVDWLSDQGWLDPATRTLLADGRQWLGSLDNARQDGQVI
jgi:DNA-directed RNA polymerase specialized sigma24 family protein